MNTTAGFGFRFSPSGYNAAMAQKITQSLSTPPDTIISGRSPVQVMFRMAVLMLVILILWIGILLNTYWSTQNEIVTMLADDEKTLALLKVQDTVVFFVGWLGLFVVAAVLIVGTWIAIRTALIRMVVERHSITPPEGEPIKFENIGAIVFYTVAIERDRMLHEGVLVAAHNSPNTTLDSIYLLPPGIDVLEFTKDRYLLPTQAAAILRFYLHSGNEAIARRIAENFLTCNENGKVWTVINRYQKQRVVWRKNAD